MATLESLKGVGQASLKELKGAGIATLDDLMGYFPRDYEFRDRLVQFKVVQYKLVPDLMPLSQNTISLRHG